jgi:LysR family glycine cleavage system transcriptional activator
MHSTGSLSEPSGYCSVKKSGVLTVSTSPDFAAKWLVNRLSRFADNCPEVDLRVAAATHHVDFARDDGDVAIRHGDGHLLGLDVERLYSERLFPVCSPKLVAGRNRIRKAADLFFHCCVWRTRRFGHVCLEPQA